jgi:phage terminase large subunit-like protein
MFPIGNHDDQVDALSGAFEKVSDVRKGELQIVSARRPW